MVFDQPALIHFYSLALAQAGMAFLPLSDLFFLLVLSFWFVLVSISASCCFWFRLSLLSILFGLILGDRYT